MAHDLVGVPLGVHLDHDHHISDDEIRAHLIEAHGIDPARLVHCRVLASRHALAHVRDDYEQLLEAS